MNRAHATAAYLNRLHVRQAARVLAVALALGALFSTIQIAIDLHNERQNVRATILQVLNSLSRPAGQAAFSVSPYLAEGVVDSLLKYQPIHTATLSTETGAVLAQRSRPLAPDRTAWLADWLTRGEREFKLPLYTPNLNEPVGYVTVQVDASVLASGVLARAGLTVLFDLLKNTGLALAVTVVFYYTLSRPLTALSRALAQAQQLRTATSLHVQLGRHADEEMHNLLAAANRFLENQVAARTDALRQQNEQLQRLNAEVQAARAEAESATQAKSRFLANMSHELRTPLNAILGYAQILDRDGGLSERQLRGITTIERSGSHLLALINDVLDLSRIEAAKFTLEPQAMALAAFIDGIGDIVRVKAEEKLLRFFCTLEPGLPAAVLCDEKRLRQVLLNLLGNAIKFTQAGHVSLRVQHRPHDVPGEARLRFTVHDSGVGMTAEELTRIFQPFEQAGDMGRRANGTGLGLAISAQIVALMGGHIDVQSSPREGSRFWFELVLPLASSPAATRMAPVIAGYEGARRSVLVIDDQEGNRAMLADLLEGLGFITWEAIDGQSGLDSMRRDLPDLVITDIAMPGIDGMELMRIVRADAALRHVPIIAVSASISMAGEAASLEAGANAFLPKPIDQPALLERIGACLRLRWTTAMAATPPEPPTDAPMLAPPPADIEQLYALAMTGNMRSIHRFATELATRDARYRPFATRLQALADGYQSRAILALAQHHLGLPS
ncbi:ATP-binding protein [Pseudoduganella rivuli]|nr:ATP-binding protein [Pseudoduganella rivuli]